MITTAGAPTRIGGGNRETNSEKEGHEEARGRLLASQSIEQENEDLDLIQGNVKRLGVMGLEITNKLDEHNTQIEDLSDKVDQTNSNVGGVKAKIARVVGTNRRDRILSAVVCVLVLVLICVVIASVVSKKKKK